MTGKPIAAAIRSCRYFPFYRFFGHDWSRRGIRLACPLGNRSSAHLNLTPVRGKHFRSRFETKLMELIILRCVFLICAGGVSWIINTALPSDADVNPYIVFIGVMGVAVAAILGDIFIPRKRIDSISAVYFGVLIGILLSYILWIAIAPLFAQALLVGNAVKLIMGMLLCYLCTSVLIQTKDDFRFLIPYVEFVREVKGFKPLVLDTSVVIDGRIADLVKTGVFDNQLIMPRFALSELQAIADSSDKLRRVRGRRGLDVLNRMRADDSVESLNSSTL